MATWVIGDIQGCMSSLERLLDRLALDPARDRLWLAGDLVNRGPRNLDVLRWARAQPGLVTVLGNHDLHLLQRIAGVAKAKKRDTIDDVLGAPDRDELADWLRRRPLVWVEGGHVLVHAGLHPAWTVARARELAAEVEAGLAGDGWRTWIAQLAGDAPAWRDGLTGGERVRAVLAYLVRVRMLRADGTCDEEFNGPPAEAPAGETPWFEWPSPAWGDHVVVFGHWAALGLSMGRRHVATDTGCVWGSSLTAVCLEDRRVVQVKAVEAAS